MIEDKLDFLAGELVHSANDDREYRRVVLPNGLRVLLVHDSKAEKSSAALNVAVGNSSDPKELPGLAHFLEHMLFLGTAKYPQENEYNLVLLSFFIFIFLILSFTFIYLFL